MTPSIIHSRFTTILLLFMASFLAGCSQGPNAPAQTAQALPPKGTQQGGVWVRGSANILAGSQLTTQSSPHLQSVESLLEESVAAFGKGDFSRASDKASQAVALQPSNTFALITRAGALAKLGRLDEAITDCRQALALEPDNGLAHNTLGYVHELRGELEPARQSYAKSCKVQTALGCQNLQRLSQ